MNVSDELIGLLRERAASLGDEPSLTEESGVESVLVVGSLARRDFILGGSDVDLMLVHGHGDRPASTIAAIPGVRVLVRHFGDALLSKYGETGRQKPFMVDLHFVDRGLLLQQREWADPAAFRAEYASRDHFLWLYAFDFAAHRDCLYGDDPGPSVRVHPPASYATWVVEDLRSKLLLLESMRAGESLIAGHKLIAGETLKLVALCHGASSLMKVEVYEEFQRLVPCFEGKGFAEQLWAEYVHGPGYAPADRTQWVRDCRAFCEAALATI